MKDEVGPIDGVVHSVFRGPRGTVVIKHGGSYVRYELLDSMRIAIRTLPDELREPLLLHYHEGYALSEVGRLLGLPAGTVKSRLFAARKMLRGMLKED